MAFGLTKKELSWVLYDVGNSAFVMLSTALIPVYFASIADPGSSVVVAWGYAETVASLVLALLMPVLGSLADLAGNKRSSWLALRAPVLLPVLHWAFPNMRLFFWLYM